MAYLHENRDLFQQVLNQAQNLTGLVPEIIEKDYYVTVILHELACRLPFIVFKGGTSLSKCYQVIDRYSEDIDITVDTRLTQGQKKTLKASIEAAATMLGLSIPNLAETRSRRSYNRYVIQYTPLYQPTDAAVQARVLLETSFAEVSFPVVTLPVHSIVGDMLADEAPPLLKQYDLQPFPMKVQSIARTLIDKVFALGDYYLAQREIDKHSRHLYDIYKLLPLVTLDDNFRQLVRQVRQTRAANAICLSAQADVGVTALLSEIIATDAYKYGYNHLTVRLLAEKVSYEQAISALRVIADRHIF